MSLRNGRLARRLGLQDQNIRAKRPVVSAYMAWMGELTFQRRREKDLGRYGTLL